MMTVYVVLKINTSIIQYLLTIFAKYNIVPLYHSLDRNID